MQRKRIVLALVALLALAFFFLAPSSNDGPAPAPGKQASKQAPTKLTDLRAQAPAGAEEAAARSSRTSTAPTASALVFEAGWGGKVGQLGHRVANESNPEAPAALAVQGEDVVVLDQVNGRVQRFRRGVAISTFETTETVQNIAFASNGRTVLLDRLTDKTVTVVGQDGKVISEIPIEGNGLESAADSTAVIADETGIYVENQHEGVIRIADADGNPDPKRTQLPGRPTRDGKMVVTAAIMDAPAGIAILSAFDKVTLMSVYAIAINFSRPLLQILMVESDTQGNVYVAAEGAREREDHTSYDAAIMAYRFGRDGAITGHIELPAGTSGDETVRPLTIGEDGALYVMIASENGMAVSRHTF